MICIPVSIGITYQWASGTSGAVLIGVFKLKWIPESIDVIFSIYFHGAPRQPVRSYM